MTIDHCYWEQDCEHYRARQAEKEALESHSQKQGKASTSGSSTASQNKANSAPVASSAKNSSSKSSPSPAPKKCLENNLCLYCSAEDHKLDSCPKKQTTVFSKGCSASATADTLAVASEKPSEK